MQTSAIEYSISLSFQCGTELNNVNNLTTCVTSGVSFLTTCGGKYLRIFIWNPASGLLKPSKKRKRMKTERPKIFLTNWFHFPQFFIYNSRYTCMKVYVYFYPLSHLHLWCIVYIYFAIYIEENFGKKLNGIFHDLALIFNYVWILVCFTSNSQF